MAAGRPHRRAFYSFTPNRFFHGAVFVQSSSSSTTQRDVFPSPGNTATRRRLLKPSSGATIAGGRLPVNYVRKRADATACRMESRLALSAVVVAVGLQQPITADPVRLSDVRLRTALRRRSSFVRRCFLLSVCACAVRRIETLRVVSEGCRSVLRRLDLDRDAAVCSFVVRRRLGFNKQVAVGRCRWCSARRRQSTESLSSSVAVGSTTLRAAAAGSVRSTTRRDRLTPR